MHSDYDYSNVGTFDLRLNIPHINDFQHTFSFELALPVCTLLLTMHVIKIQL